MKESTAIHSTFVLERSYPAAPERVFTAFADPAFKRRWFAEGLNHTVEEFSMDFRPGGSERVAYRFNEGTVLAGMSMIAEGRFMDVIPNLRIVTASTMAFGEKPFSASLVTIELLVSDQGTDLICTHLICTHQGAFFEGADGPQMREAGWRKLLDQLAREFTNQ